MRYVAQFVRLRERDNYPVPVGHPAQVAAQIADDAIVKLRKLASSGHWPEFADAVRLYEDGREVDSFIATLPGKPYPDASA